MAGDSLVPGGTPTIEGLLTTAHHTFHSISSQDGCRDLLAVMISPSSMTIWNADTGVKVSRFTFTETIMALAFNPFQPENLICESEPHL